MNKTIKIPCNCFGFHYIEIHQDGDDLLWYSINADNHASVWFRIKEAFKYIIGTRELYWHEIVINKKDLKRLKDFLNKI